MAFADLFVQALARKKMQEAQDQTAAPVEENNPYLTSVRPRSVLQDGVVWAPPKSLPPYVPDKAGAASTPQLPNPASQSHSPYTSLPIEQAVSQPIPDPPQTSQHTGGLGGRLKDALVGLALMGPVGGIASLINPQLAHNARHNMLDVPRYQQEQSLRQKLLGEQVGNMTALGSMTGRIPGSGGQPTEQAKVREAQQQWTQTYQGGLLDLRKQAEADADKKAQDYHNKWVAENARKTAKDKATGFHHYLNDILPAGPVDQKSHDYIKETFGYEVPVGTDTRKIGTVVDAAGNINWIPKSGTPSIVDSGVSSFKVTEEKNKKERAQIIAGKQTSNQASKGEPSRDKVYEEVEKELDRRFPKQATEEENLAIMNTIKEDPSYKGLSFTAAQQKYIEDRKAKRQASRAQVEGEVIQRMKNTPNMQQGASGTGVTVTPPYKLQPGDRTFTNQKTGKKVVVRPDGSQVELN